MSGFTHQQNAAMATPGQSLATLEAILRIQAGTGSNREGANENVLSAPGCRLDEMEGQPHRSFNEPKHALSAEYAGLRRGLNSGDYMTGRFRQGGKNVWSSASHGPILDMNRNATKTTKFAADVTGRFQLGADEQGRKGF